MNAPSTRMAMVALLALAAAAARPADTGAMGEDRIQLKDAPGRDLTAARCVICHSVDYIQMNAAVMDRAGWERSIQKMTERFGAPVDAAEARKIVEYLSTHYSRQP